MINTKHMTHAVICRETDNALNISRILRDTQKRHLIVLDSKDYPVGIISTIDINNRVVAEGKNPETLAAKDIMTKNVKIVSAEDSYDKAFKMMTELGTYSIPVIKNSKLLGLLEFMTAFKLKQNSNR